MKFSNSLILIVLIVLAAGLFSCSNKVRIDLQINSNDTPVKRAIDKFKNNNGTTNFEITTSNPDVIVSGIIDTTLNPEEAYKIRQNGRTVTVTGGSASGLAYGLHNVKKLLAEGNITIPEIDETPYYSFRAIKFNLPWASYRSGEALQQHFETCRDTLFWESFLDMMMENRFNKLTL